MAQKNGKPLRQEPLVTDKISNLLRSVEKPASYDPQQFATQMRAIHGFLMQ
jgi:flagellar biosynthesis/type III secretory pathway chaperone